MLLAIGVVLATLGIGLIEGSEISLFTLAAASKYRWRKAWMVCAAGLLTLIPILALFYFFFSFIPVEYAIILAGIIIFALGAHFFKEGYDAFRERHEKAGEEEEKLGAGILGIYSATVLEGTEASGISMAIGTAAGGAYFSSTLGMAIGLVLPLLAMKLLQPQLERLPEWIVQLAVGSVMMVAAVLILLFRF